MKKQIIAAFSTHPVRAAFLLILLFLLGSVMHQALGQGNTGKRSVAANMSQVAPPSTGAITGTYTPANPAPNIPAVAQSQLVAPAAPAAGPWTVATPYPTNIARYGFAQTATHLYVFGGVSDGIRVNNVNRMDIASGTWQSRAAMPFTSEAPTCALMASTSIVYCTEGDTGNGFASYNIATDTWTPLAAIPGDPHYGSASGAFNGKVFVAGGTAAFTNLVQVYDVAANTWSAGTAAPNDFVLAGYQQVGQYLYVVGGFEVSGPDKVGAELSSVLSRSRQPELPVPLANNTTTWRLDMSSAPGVWSVGPAFTPSRADFALAYDAGTNTLYAIGGDATGGGFFDSTNLVDELSVASWPAGSWTASPPNLLLPNRQANQAGFFGGAQIWSVGGLDGSTFTFLAEVQRRTNGAACNPNWVVRAPVPYSARGIFAASDGTSVYAGGGYDGTNVRADLLRYDPVADSWTPLASSPDQHFLSQAVYYNGKIYNIGGFDGASNTTSITRIYTIGTDTWSTGAPMPAALTDHATALWNGIIYVAGGSNGGAVNTLYAYNIAGDSWTTLAPLPQALFLPGFGAINGKVYVASGNNGATEVNTLYIYDIATNTWTTGAAVPTPVTGPGSTVFNGQLYLYGGAAPFPTTITSTQIYNPGSNTWSSGPNMNVSRLWFYGTAISGGSIVAPGGDTTPGLPINDNEQLANCAPAPSSAVSRKTHGGAGTFDINLPLVAIGGAVGIEDRTGAVAGAHQMVVTFASNVTVGGVSITSGTGGATFSVAGAVVTVNLTGVTNAQRLGVTLFGVNDGTSTGDVFIPMGILSGDTAASGTVSAADVSQTKAQSGNGTVAGNFRMDVNSSGSINAADVGLVKSRVGTVLPP